MPMRRHEDGDMVSTAIIVVIFLKDRRGFKKTLVTELGFKLNIDSLGPSLLIVMSSSHLKNAL
eukprot:25097-Eustigmatos_ZCMA.PRE.1